jgi:hypothetical protein
MDIQDKTKEEFLNELQQLKHENQMLKVEGLELKLANDSFRKKITNCEAIFESRRFCNTVPEMPCAVFTVLKTHAAAVMLPIVKLVRFVMVLNH